MRQTSVQDGASVIWRSVDDSYPSRPLSLDVLDLVLLLRGRFCQVSKRESPLVKERTIMPRKTNLQGRAALAQRQLTMHACHTVKPHCPPEFSQRCERVEFDSSRGRLINRHFEAEQTPTNIRPRPHSPAFNDIGEWLKNERKKCLQKCLQKCQQNRPRVARGQHSTVLPASMVNMSISVPKGRGEGRRFRPSAPCLNSNLATTYGASGSKQTLERIPSLLPGQNSALRAVTRVVTHGPP